MKKVLLLISAILFLSLTLIHVYLRIVSVASLACWLAGVGISVLAWYQKENRKELHTSGDYLFLTAVSVIGLIILYVFNLFPLHFHQDEFITAYTSFTLPSVWLVDWFASVPPGWVSQFPVLFHILQKPFLIALGPTITAVRISVWPYYLLTIWYLYVLARLLMKKNGARIAVLVYIVLAPNIYLSSMGLHFLSSTAFYIAAITEFLLSLKEKSRLHAVWCGIWCGVSLLTYTGSYLAFPVVMLIGLVHLTRDRSRRAVVNLIVITWITAIIVAPFALYAFHVHNFFTERIDQVQTISGSWSETQKFLSQSQSLNGILSHQIVSAFRSLYTPGIGGQGGYNFGYLAMFDRFTAIMFLLGILLAFFLLIRNKNIYMFALLTATIAPFATGFLLTIPPPALHRLAVLFPWFSVFIAQVIFQLFKRVPGISGKVLTGAVLVIFAVFNIQHAYAMIAADTKVDVPGSVAVSTYLNDTVPSGKLVYIAAFPTFHLNKVLLFQTGNKYRFITGEVPDFISGYRGEPVIVLYAKPEEIKELQSKYPKYHVITKTYKQFPLVEFTIFSPK